MTANLSSSMNATTSPVEGVKDYLTVTSKTVLLWSESLQRPLILDISTRTLSSRVLTPSFESAGHTSGAVASSQQLQIFTENFGG